MYIYIDTEEKLGNALPLLHQQNRIAFDLEFDRDRYTYGFDLCLLQIGFNDTCLIIDPMAVQDITPVFKVFEDPLIHKLVHCPGEDLRLLHSLRCYPQNISDTEVIAKLLNYEQTSLARLLELKLGKMLNKKQQQSNWHHRPLAADQLLYAADDVLYLPKLFDILCREAAEKGILHFIKQESEWLQTVRYTLEQKTDFLKPGDYKNLSPRDQFILNKLFQLRDKIAQKKNKPAYMILPEETVRAIANGIVNYRDPAAIKGLHPSLRHGSAAAELKDSIRDIFLESEQKGLSEQVKRNGLSDEERRMMYERKNRQYFLKDKLFSPIQKKLTHDFGEFAARYLLSNGWISKWLAGEVKWRDLQPPYKRELVRDIALKLQLPFGEIEEYEAEFARTEFK